MEKNGEVYRDLNRRSKHTAGRKSTVRNPGQMVSCGVAAHLSPSLFRTMPAVTLEPVQRLIADEMHAVDRVIRERLHSDVALVRQVSEHIINGGGKRLRPALVIL